MTEGGRVYPRGVGVCPRGVGVYPIGAGHAVSRAPGWCRATQSSHIPGSEYMGRACVGWEHGIL